MSGFRYEHRIQGLRDRLAREEVDAVLISDLENVRYLSGFTGSNGLILLSPSGAVFITDGRYAIQAAQEVTGFETVILTPGSNLAKTAGEQMAKLGARRVAFEEAHLFVKQWNELKAALPESIELIGKSDLVETLRQRKDESEITVMRRSIALADACFDHVRSFVKPGLTEKEVAWEIEVFLRSQGAQRLAFETIVGSGPNGALPHAHPNDRRLGESGEAEFVVLDYGAELDGYCSDITRTLVIGGEPSQRHHEVYGVVLRAQHAALAALKPGKTGKEIDAVARDLLTEAGYGEQFIHSLGHSLGRVTHDGVGFSRLSELVLEPGMVLTVEPGVYLEGWGGVRIEDDILVTEEGCEILTHSSKDLLVIP